MIVVVGSVNSDLVARVEHHPAPGETVLGSGHETMPGGKGANQAVAAARLGSDVVFVGRVGADEVWHARAAELVTTPGISCCPAHQNKSPQSCALSRKRIAFTSRCQIFQEPGQPARIVENRAPQSIQLG